MPALQPVSCLDLPPTMEEFEAAISRMKVRKAGGPSGILPELILCGGPVLQDRLLALLETVLREGKYSVTGGML